MKPTKSVLTLIGSCCLIVLLTGCASVICGPKQAVAIDSKPHGAEVLIYDSHCDVVFHKNTPCVANLSRRTDDYTKANYVVLIKKEGFAPVQIPLTGEVNKAFFGNLLFGGLGMAVDPFTGAMWTLTPDTLDPQVADENAAFFSNPSGGYLVTLKEAEAPDVAQQDAPPQPQKQAQPQAQTDAQPQAQSDAQPKAQNDAQPQGQNDAQPQTPKDSSAQAQTDAQPQANTDAQAPTNGQPQAQKDAQPQAQKETKPEAQKDSQPPVAQKDGQPEN